MRLQTASDVTEQTKVRLVYQTFASTTGANAYLNETPNANGSYVDFIKGLKDSCADCSGGLPYQYRVSRSFRT